MSLSRIRIMALGALAVGITASGLAGCSDDSGNTIVLGSSSIPVITGLSTPAAMTDGQTPAGTAIRLQILGDDFDKNAEVRLLAKSPATLDPNAANINSGVAGVTSSAAFIRIPTTNLEWQSQNRIDIIVLPASPLAGANQQGTVIVQVVNPGGVVNTDGTADGSSTSDELTYYADTGLQATVAQAGPLAGAWTNVFPGQSGIEVEATLTNMTLEPVKDIKLTDRALSFGSAHVLNYVIKEPATSLAVGATTTARFLVAFSNELPEGTLSGACNYSAIGSTSGRSYTGTGSVAFTAGSTPTITTRGGNNVRQGGVAGTGGNIVIDSQDNNDAAAATATLLEGGVTIGAAAPVNLTNDAGAAITTAPAVTVANLIAGTAGAIGATHTYVNETIEFTAGGAKTLTFTGNFAVVFRGCTFRFANTVDPGLLTITTDSTVQFINCTIDVTDRKALPTVASGGVTIDGCNAQAGSIDLQGTTIRSNGVRALVGGNFVATAAGPVTILTDIAAAGASPIKLTGTTINTFGAGMVNATGLPGVAGTTTPGQAIGLATQAGPIQIDATSTLNSSGGDALAFTVTTGAGGAGVTITSGASLAEKNDIILNGRIDTRGGDALNAAAGNGGNVTLTGRKINIGNGAGRPVLLTNGGSNSIVGGISLLGINFANPAGTGGDAGDITINPQEGVLSIAAGSGLIAIGGGGDTQANTADGGNITFGVSDLLDVDAEANVSVVTMAGVADSSGGWVRVTGTAGDGGTINVGGNTNVTVSGALLAQGGSPARSANSSSPVNGANNGGVGGDITVTAGRNQTVGNQNIGVLQVSGLVGSRGGFYTLGAGGAGGTGGAINLHGEGVNVTTSGKLISDGGSCGDNGQAAGGTAGAITVNSGLLNAGLAGSVTAGTPAADATNLIMAGLIQADGGNTAKGTGTNSGRFNLTSTGGTTVSVNWPTHGAATGDLVTVTGSTAGNATSKPVTVLDANNFTYVADSNVAVGSYTGDMTLAFVTNATAQGQSAGVILRQDNVARVGLTPTIRDGVEVSGQVFARARKAGTPGTIRVSASRVDAGTDLGVRDGGNVVITQSGVLTAAGAGAAITLATEDEGVMTVNGKLTVDNDRPGAQTSVAGNMLLTILATPTNAVAGTNGSITVGSTAELLVSGGHSGAGAGTLAITNLCTGPVNLTAAFIRSEDQTVDASSVNGGKGGRIVISGAGAVNHTAGEITARGTGSALGNGGQIEFAATDNAGTISLLNLGGTGTARVDGGGANGWGGRIQARAALTSGAAAAPAVLINGTYTLSANGSGRGGAGLPIGATSSLRVADGGLTDGGIYIGALANQIVTVGTTTAITATGGDNGSGVRNANGTPANGCNGGVIAIGDGADLGTLLITSSLNVSGGANNSGPGGTGGQIVVRPGGGNAAMTVAGTVAATWTANGGSSSFPQSMGGPAGNMRITPPAAGTGTIQFGGATTAFAANLLGGGGPTVGGDGGVFAINAPATVAGGMTFGAAGARIGVGGGTGSITGANGVVRLVAAAGAPVQIPVTGTPANPTNLTVEPANGASGNPVQTLFVVD